MNKFILLFFIGAVCCASCQKEEPEDFHKQNNADDNSIEESVKIIEKLQIENLPDKSCYLLHEALVLDGLSVSITYTDGSVLTLSDETIPQEWINGFSSEEPFRGKEIIIRPVGVPEDLQVSFAVDILPLIVEGDEVVAVLESEFKRIQIPEGIKSIRDEAFGKNQELEEISLPSTLENIGTYTFYGSNLQTVDLGKSILKVLPSGTFESCKNLTQVVLPKTLKVIGGNAFYGTVLLKEIEIPEGVEDIGNTVFSASGIVSVRLPNTVRTIKRSFYKCNALKEITTYGMDYVGNDPERSIIGESFQFCPNLETLQIPGGITQIGISVLGVCKVKELTIPSNVERIEFNAFGNASSLQKVMLLGDKKKIIEANAFPAEVLYEVLRQNETLSK